MNLQLYLSHVLSESDYQIAKQEQERYNVPLVSIVRRLHLIPDFDQWILKHYQSSWIESIAQDVLLLSSSACAYKNGDCIALIVTDPTDIQMRDDAIQSAQKIWDHPIQLYWTDPSEIAKHTRHEDVLIDLLSQAAHASDLHVHRFGNFVELKLRIDGWLSPYKTFTQNEWESLNNRLKIMAHLDIAESRRPQSGHVELALNGHLIDLRISTHPTIHGENLAIRFLTKNKGVRKLEDLGFLSFQIELLRKIKNLSHGLVVLCGPTGSGKTTTLYSLLSEFDTQRFHIATLEDPIEYQLPGISQTEIHQGLLDYRDGIRSLLRQDPDIMLIGEIRDEDTARMAFRASLTGHLVLTTLHVPCALACHDRLLNFGVPSFEIDHYLKTVIAQKLVRKICASCYGQGCLHCSYSGSKGRTVIAEIWIPPSRDFPTMNEHANVLIKNGVIPKKQDHEAK